MEDDKHHALPGDFDPLLIGILGCFAGVFMVAAYHFVTTRCTSPAADSDNDREANRPELWPSTSNSSRLPTYRHPGQGKQDGTCAVCLSEYGDGEMIRVLPECLHSFHAPCIDMWLYSHSSCPLCRANTRLLPLPLPRRRFVPSSEARFQRDSAPATLPEGDDETSTRQVTVYMPSLDEDTTPVSAASATVQAGERTSPGHLGISTSHSDQNSLPSLDEDTTPVQVSERTSPGPLGISTSHSDQDSLPTPPLPDPNTSLVMPHSPI